MGRPVVITGVVAILIGLLVGYLWWGLPSSRLQAERDEAKATAARLEQEVGELRTRSQQLETQLKSEQASLQAVTADLNTQKAMNSRLQVLIGSGRK